VLIEAQVPIMNLSECRTKSSYNSKEIKNNMICAGLLNGTTDACEVRIIDEGGIVLKSTNFVKFRVIVEDLLQ